MGVSSRVQTAWLRSQLTVLWRTDGKASTDRRARLSMGSCVCVYREVGTDR